MVAVTLEGSTYTTDALPGPDALWSIPLKDGQENPYHNHFEMPVVDVCNALIHVRVHDKVRRARWGPDSAC